MIRLPLSPLQSALLTPPTLGDPPVIQFNKCSFNKQYIYCGNTGNVTNTHPHTHWCKSSSNKPQKQKQQTCMSFPSGVFLHRMVSFHFLQLSFPTNLSNSDGVNQRLFCLMHFSPER